MNLSMIWLLAGMSLCGLEFLLPTAFVALTMGISAIVMALVSLVIPQVSVQVVLWLLLSVVLTVLSHRLVPQGRASTIEDAREAQTLTAIEPGQTGRVVYEGNSWQAECGDETVTIAPQQRVYVVGRRGNTLIVMPVTALH